MKCRLPENLDETGKKLQEIVRAYNPEYRLVEVYFPAQGASTAINGSTGETVIYAARKGEWVGPYNNHGKGYSVWAAPKKGSPITFSIDLEHGIRGVQG